MSDAIHGIQDAPKTLEVFSNCMPTLITVPYCTAEIFAGFGRPMIQLIADKAAPFQTITDALLPFGFSFENAEANGAPLAQHRTTFRIPTRNISFEFGVQSYRFVKDPFTWDTDIEDLKVLQAAEDALISLGAQINTRSMIIGKHVQLLETSRDNLLAPLAPKPFFAEDIPTEYKPEQFGVSLKLPHGSILIEYSKALANGIYVRMSAELDGRVSLLEIAENMRRYEQFLAQTLNIDGDQS